jgi:hypothetical protein
MPDLATNVLYYGDNLDILCRYLPDAAVHLVCLDPPFNSNPDDNVILRDESGKTCDAQLLAFEDTWHWGPAAEATRGRGAPRGVRQRLGRRRRDDSQAPAFGGRPFGLVEQSRNSLDCGRELRVVRFCVTPELGELCVADVVAPQAVAKRSKDATLPLHSLRHLSPTEPFHEARIAVIPDSSRVPQTVDV